MTSPFTAERLFSIIHLHFSPRCLKTGHRRWRWNPVSSATRLSLIIIRIRGFVSPGYPEFTFSETLLIIDYSKKTGLYVTSVTQRAIFLRREV